MMFEINSLNITGGWLALCPMPGRFTPYAQDLASITDWAPQIVVSLAEHGEMKAKGADGLGADLARSGTLWHHLPVVDYDVPDMAGKATWHTLSPVLHDCLAGGGRVLVHCMGGCGRSGMVALRLMVEAGEKGDAALTRLRNTRSCAVETEAQMAWALEGAL